MLDHDQAELPPAGKPVREGVLYLRSFTMTRWTVLFCTVLAAVLLLLGCTGGGDPVSPEMGEALTPQITRDQAQSHSHLWAFYDCEIDLDTLTVNSVLNRRAMFTSNVVTFLNNNPATLQFQIQNTVVTSDYVDVDINVSITHPFPGLPAYNGYDVRGVFIGDATDKLDYLGKLRYPVFTVDQYMMADPNDPFGFGAPDGYTRWYNRAQFSTPGLFGYMPGIYATPGYYANATLNPYKYFMDNLGPSDFFWPAMEANQSHRGVFRSGATNFRNYYLRFPTYKGTKYSYAVIADWESEIVHPANAFEAVAAEILTDDNELWYIDGNFNGGEIIADIKLWNWETTVGTTGMVENYQIYIESDILDYVYELTPDEMIPIASASYWHQFHVEIPSDAIPQTDGNEMWVIVEYPLLGYWNSFGVDNACDLEPLAAFFRHPLVVADYAINEEPVCDLQLDNGMTMPTDEFKPAVITFDATGTYDPDPNDTLVFDWDFDGDGVYNESDEDDYLGPQDNPTHLYYEDFVGDVSLRVRDGNTGEAICSIAVDVTVYESKNILLRPGVDARDIAIDHTNGDLLVAFSDNRIWKYTRASFYQTGALFINTSSGYWATSPYLIDMAPNQYTMVGGLYYSYNSSFIYNPSGNQLNTYFWLTWNSTACDVIAMGSNGDFANDLSFLHGYTQLGIKHNIVRRHADPTYLSGYAHDYTFPEIYYDGYDKIYYDYIVGAESDSDDDYIWVLEDADLYASRWEIDGGPPWDLTYADAYFGTGSQTNNDDGFWFPQDISRDDENRLFVLDQLSSGDPSVKVFEFDGVDVESLGSFGDTNVLGDTDCINGQGLRIEGSDYEGIIVVLHGSSPPYRISVFQTAEMISE